MDLGFPYLFVPPAQISRRVRGDGGDGRDDVFLRSGRDVQGGDDEELLPQSARSPKTTASHESTPAVLDVMQSSLRTSRVQVSGSSFQNTSPYLGVSKSKGPQHRPKDTPEGPSTQYLRTPWSQIPFRVWFLEPESLNIGYLDPLGTIILLTGGLPKTGIPKLGIPELPKSPEVWKIAKVMVGSPVSFQGLFLYTSKKP